MATAYRLVIPSMMQVWRKYVNGPPKFSMSATKSTDSPTMLLGSNRKGRTWKKNRGPRSPLDKLGLRMITVTHKMTTTMTTKAIIQAPSPSHSRHSSHLKKEKSF